MEPLTEVGEMEKMPSMEGGEMKEMPSMEGDEMKKMPSRSISRQQSSRQFERSKSILESGRTFSRSTSILRAEEVAIETPASAESPLVLSFDGLEHLDVKPEDLLPAGPAGALHGVFENGIRYYVRKNAKPRDRAALALAVSVG